MKTTLALLFIATLGLTGCQSTRSCAKPAGDGKAYYTAKKCCGSEKCKTSGKCVKAEKCDYKKKGC